MEGFDGKVCGRIYDSKAWLDLVLQLVVRFTPHEAGFTLPIFKSNIYFLDICGYLEGNDRALNSWGG